MLFEVFPDMDRVFRREREHVASRRDAVFHRPDVVLNVWPVAPNIQDEDRSVYTHLEGAVNDLRRVRRRRGSKGAAWSPCTAQGKKVFEICIAPPKLILPLGYHMGFINEDSGDAGAKPFLPKQLLEALMFEQDLW
jgi:hypothetical protein